MTPPSYDDSRAMDLSGLAAKAAQPPASAGGSYVVDVDEANFEQVMQLSLKHPVVVELYSPRAQAEALSQALIELADAAAGKYLLARVNVDTSPQIPQAFGIQAVPTVLGVVGGQLAPLFQGTKSKEEAEAVIGQLLQMAVANGVVGRADPVEPARGEAVDEAPIDPRFEVADAAIERGDFAAARDEFDKILAQTPNDAEAIAGRAQVSLLARLAGVDAGQVLSEAHDRPDDVPAQLAAADIEVAAGTPELGFERLVDVVRSSAGDDREQARLRLLELFEIVGGSDPAVLKARRNLMSALF